jgi:hypothetical protein
MRLGRDQGGIQRGDRADTGDLEARPSDGARGGGSDLEDLTILEAGDPELGLTGTSDIPAQDWAADTGPARTGEGGAHGVDSRLADHERAPGGRRIEFDNSDSKQK